MTYTLPITDEYGLGDELEFEDVYEAKERLLDALDRAGGPGREWELLALLEEVESEIRVREWGEE
jgi:hypothetical protein